MRLAPAWVLPATDLAEVFMEQGRLADAKTAIDSAETIDPSHPYLVHSKALWYSKQNGRAEKEKALQLFEQYRQSGGPMYACWHNAYGLVLSTVGKVQEAEIEFFKAIALDSFKPASWPTSAVYTT